MTGQIFKPDRLEPSLILTCHCEHVNKLFSTAIRQGVTSSVLHVFRKFACTSFGSGGGWTRRNTTPPPHVRVGAGWCYTMYQQQHATAARVVSPIRLTYKSN